MCGEGDKALGVTEVVAAGLITGIATGLVHAAAVAIRTSLASQFGWYPREFVWMAPLSYAILFVAAALPLLLGHVIAPTLVTRRVVWWVYAAAAAFALTLEFNQISRFALLVFAAGLASALSAPLARLCAPTRTRHIILAALLFVTGAGAAVERLIRSSGQALVTVRGEAATEDMPNVLLIILDTVRAASLSLYGYPQSTTPNLDALAAEGVVFDWAISTSPWTLPSHASMFTGQYPTSLDADWERPLDTDSPVLAEVLQARGYATGAFVGNLHYTAWDSGLLRGFDTRSDYQRSWHQVLMSSSFAQTGSIQKIGSSRSWPAVLEALRDPDLSVYDKHTPAPHRADAITEEFLEWQSAVGEKPWFAFLNYFDAHLPYYAPERFMNGETDPEGQYRAAIRWVDANLGRLFDTLRRQRRLDNTIVIVAADHGELFNEHGISGHGFSLYQNVLRVPLVIRFPRAATVPVRITDEVSLRDLAATILDLAGVTSKALPGASLRSYWEGATQHGSPAISSVRRAPRIDSIYPAANGALSSVFSDSLHLIREWGTHRDLLFRYREDPDESGDLIHRGTIPSDSLVTLLPPSANQ